MFSYPRHLKSGHITCYLNRTYDVLTTGRLEGRAKQPVAVLTSSVRALILRRE